jgi:hypothetical protein
MFSRYTVFDIGTIIATEEEAGGILLQNTVAF